jgi:hypothetical protein
MPVHTKDLPGAENEPQPEAETKVAAVNDQSADILAAAAASGDAAVHNLLGHRVVAEQNADAAALKEIDKQLADLVKVK